MSVHLITFFRAYNVKSIGVHWKWTLSKVKIPKLNMSVELGQQ